MPEVLRQGREVTLVSYGATLRIVGESAELPNRETIFESVYDLMRESNPRKFPKFP